VRAQRYWPSTAGTDTDPHHTFRPHEKAGYRLRRQTRRNDVEQFHKMEDVLFNLRNARNLLAMCHHREVGRAGAQGVTAITAALPPPPLSPHVFCGPQTIKRELVAVSTDVFEQLVDSCTNLTGVPRRPTTPFAPSAVRALPPFHIGLTRRKDKEIYAMGGGGMGGGFDGDGMGDGMAYADIDDDGMQGDDGDGGCMQAARGGREGG
jgi:hypothetical protein